MNTLNIRRVIGVNTYRHLKRYYQILNFYLVVKPVGLIASYKIRRSSATIPIDLHFGAGYGAILNEVVKLLAFERDKNVRFHIRVIARYYSRSQDDCVLHSFFDEIDGQGRALEHKSASKGRIRINSLIDTPALRSHEKFSGSVADGHQLFFSRYRFKPEIVEEARSTLHALTDGKKSLLGIHYRGTDKTSGDRWAEGNPIDAKEFLDHAKSILSHFPDIDGVYVTTDEQKFLDYARREITSHPVYGEDLKRHAALGMGLHIMPGDPAEKAKEAVLIMLMLAQCHYMIKTTSLLSAWAKVINPALKVFVPQKPRVETGGYVFPDKDVYETAEPLPTSLA